MGGDINLDNVEHGNLSEEELFLAAGCLYDRIGELKCPRCGSFRARFSRIRLSQGLGLLPRPCRVLGVFSLIPAFEDAWLSLEPTTRPVLVFGTSLAVEEDPGGEKMSKLTTERRCATSFWVWPDFRRAAIMALIPKSVSRSSTEKPRSVSFT